MMYFVKALKSGKGLVVAEELLTKRAVTMPDGSVREFNRQGKGKLGFVACVGFSAHDLILNRGDEMDLNITDVPVKDKDGKIIPNLYWAE